ncbi:MAG TPA: aminoacyl-tRNA hydrolase [Myxococcales bacterium]|nr:aminoacyl-tRNA hydrolase [Myxococcales bacterium]
MKLVCGLGNPGREYERHRHNVGFMIAERLAARARADLSQEKFGARIGQGSLSGERVLFVLPQTFMNLSGTAVAGAARFYKVPPADVLVVHDELDLPFGRLQLKSGGGAGGHNGLKSILELYGEDGFARLRFGIGKPEGPGAKERVSSHVLSGFSTEEAKALEPLLDRATDMAEAWVQEGLQAAMNRHNRK